MHKPPVFHSPAVAQKPLVRSCGYRESQYSGIQSTGETTSHTWSSDERRPEYKGP